MASAATPDSSLSSLFYRSSPTTTSPDTTELDYSYDSPKTFFYVNFSEGEDADMMQETSALHEIKIWRS